MNYNNFKDSFLNNRTYPPISSVIIDTNIIRNYEDLDYICYVEGPTDEDFYGNIQNLSISNKKIKFITGLTKNDEIKEYRVGKESVIKKYYEINSYVNFKYLLKKSIFIIDSDNYGLLSEYYDEKYLNKKVFNITNGYAFENYFFSKRNIRKIFEYFNEFVECNSDINGAGSLDKVLYGYSFEEALDMCLNMKNEEYARSLNRCPSETFLLIRKNDNKIIGTINVRWNLTEEMKKFGGNIGYSIRPTERRKGYNKINLYLGLIKANKLNLDRVMLDCDVNNIGSDRTMKALGGVLERTEIDPYDGILTNVYWFDVKKCIDKYKDVYEKFIDNNNYIKKKR